ncbi:arsenite efflux transporter metallochaperone ArsD [Priestia flexa]|jgi:Arsenical resistance operon protein ArsD|uniref:arsenite efflux transporter metallochaperone ArsD n=1 Tax=Priestia flexa TaxID=86664 RepID=UPI0009541FBE|nr:arsenite efflux transporter metallochaperone ArsD [Priestia flexa]MBY6087543.1 arsenite efflux transporter metallochaperone ArsD [Priestia flexa]SIR51235.1 Arsenical resistance operon trans-acting repressor ArsD [Priestia flexa]
MKKIEIFDPAMCCSTGVCGPSVDPELTRIATVISQLKKGVVEVERYNLTSDPGHFVENQQINALLMSKGTDCLPITLIDGEVKKISSYPTNEEISKWLEVNLEDLKVKSKTATMPITLNITNNK